MVVVLVFKKGNDVIFQGGIIYLQKENGAKDESIKLFS